VRRPYYRSHATAARSSACRRPFSVKSAGGLGSTPAVNHVLNDRGIVVQDLTRSIAQRAGQLLAVARMSSANAVDAFVVASALEFDRALIATGDPDDIRRLAARHLGVFRI
jgi:hypothetical protein